MPGGRSGRLSPGHGRERQPTHWLLVRGSAARPLDGPVDVDAIRLHRTTRRPAVQAGDTAVLYAAVWQAVFAVVRITGDPEHDAARERWAWSFPLRGLVAVPHLDLAPPVEAAGIFPRSVWRHSHIRLEEERFAAACDAVEAAAAGPQAGAARIARRGAGGPDGRRGRARHDGRRHRAGVHRGRLRDGRS